MTVDPEADASEVRSATHQHASYCWSSLSRSSCTACLSLGLQHPERACPRPWLKHKPRTTVFRTCSATQQQDSLKSLSPLEPQFLHLRNGAKNHTFLVRTGPDGAHTECNPSLGAVATLLPS